jgi:hypothetical protein
MRCRERSREVTVYLSFSGPAQQIMGAPSLKQHSCTKHITSPLPEQPMHCAAQGYRSVFPQQQPCSRISDSSSTESLLCSAGVAGVAIAGAVDSELIRPATFDLIFFQCQCPVPSLCGYRAALWALRRNEQLELAAAQ